MEDLKTKAAFVSIVGRPNVGKSSLLNLLVGGKIAIVSSKAQTTRRRITGVKTRGRAQFVFMDTPGVHRQKTKLDSFMAGQVRQSLVGVDLVVMVAEPFGDQISAPENSLLRTLRLAKVKKMLVLSKIDLVRNKSEIIKRMAQFANEGFEAIIPVSSLTGEGLPELWKYLESCAKQSVHFFPDDAITDQPERVLAAELVRESILNNLEAEVPHLTAVITERFEPRKGRDDLLDIETTVICEKPRHKGIIIGKDGQMLKKIATEAREEMERLFGCKVNLKCWVKVKEGWQNKQQLFAALGLE